MEIWPALDVLDGCVVRLTQGDYQRSQVYHRDPFTFIEARFQGFPRRLHLVDLAGARSGVFSLHDLAARLAREGVEIAAGGGFRTLQDIERAKDAGVARVILGTQISRDAEFRHQVLDRVGANSLVAALDVRHGALQVDGWEASGPLDAYEFWSQLRDEGWYRAQVTDVSHDGVLSGVDRSFWERWAEAPGAIGAGGGIRSWSDVRLLQELGFSRVVVGRAWMEEVIPLEPLREGEC